MSRSSSQQLWSVRSTQLLIGVAWFLVKNQLAWSKPTKIWSFAWRVKISTCTAMRSLGGSALWWNAAAASRTPSATKSVKIAPNDMHLLKSILRRRLTFSSLSSFSASLNSCPSLSFASTNANSSPTSRSISWRNWRATRRNRLYQLSNYLDNLDLKLVRKFWISLMIVKKPRIYAIGSASLSKQWTKTLTRRPTQATWQFCLRSRDTREICRRMILSSGLIMRTTRQCWVRLNTSSTWIESITDDTGIVISIATDTISMVSYIYKQLQRYRLFTFISIKIKIICRC